MKPASNKSWRFTLLGLVTAALTGPAAATWLDDDTLCQTYGCVVIHDGISYQVYDVYDVVTGSLVPSGSPLILRTGGDLYGVGAVNPVITGTTTEALTTAPMEDQGALISIDTDGDGIGDFGPLDQNNSGFLDAGDTFSAFQLDAVTDIVGGSTSYQRSFYFTSTMDFYLTGEIVVGPSGEGISFPNGLSDIGFTYRIQNGGNDDGLQFGQRAQKGNTARVTGNITTLADLAGAAVPIVDVRRAIAKEGRRNQDDTVAQQSLRFDYVYDFSGYDFAMGSGDLNFEIAFDVQRR